jgi:proteic killer suppression protein
MLANEGESIYGHSTICRKIPYSSHNSLIEGPNQKEIERRRRSRGLSTRVPIGGIVLLKHPNYALTVVGKAFDKRHLSLYNDLTTICRADRDRELSPQGLETVLREGERKGVPPELADKVARILARLDVAKTPEQMDLPGLKLHPLKGELRGLWSVWVSGNWRIIFRFEGTDVARVDLVDYH